MYFYFIFLFFCLTLNADVEYSGDLSGYYRQYNFSATEIYSNKNAGLESNFKASYRSETDWRVLGDFEFQQDMYTKESKEKIFWNIKNLYLENSALPIKLRFGYITLSSEGTDIFNPMDVVHSKNWKNPMQAKTLSSIGLYGLYEFGEWSFEEFFIPLQTAYVLPGGRNPWWPREKRIEMESDNLELRIPANAEYEIQNPLDLSQARKNNILLKLDQKTPNYEMGFIFFEGLSNSPLTFTEVLASLVEIYPKVILSLDKIKVIPVYYRQRVFAGHFLIPYKSWILRGAANSLNPVTRDSRIPKWKSERAIGLEKTFETKNGILGVLLQYQDTLNLDTKNEIDFLRPFFRRAITLGSRIPIFENTQMLGGLIYDTVGFSKIYNFSIDQKLSDSFSLSVGASLLQGSKKTLLGFYDNYDSYFMTMMYYY